MRGELIRNHSRVRLRRLVLRTMLIKFRRLCWALNSTLRESVTVSTKQGTFTVFLSRDESVGRSLYCYGQHELDFMSATMRFLRSTQQCPPRGEGSILDIGANNGVTSISMLHLGELERAIAIEPEPRNFSLLQRNVMQNALDERIVCLPFAASNQKGEMQFELS